MVLHLLLGSGGVYFGRQITGVDLLNGQAEYVFHKPLWRKTVPVLLLALLWSAPILFAQLLRASDAPDASALNRFLTDWFMRQGITLKRVAWVCGAVSFPVVLMLYWGFERLIITPSAFIRVLPFGRRNGLRWTDIDEVLIEHIVARFEGRASVHKVLTLYAVKKRFMPWRRKFRISNRQFEGYHRVEQIATHICIPAIAARKRAEMKHSGRPACFAERKPTDDIKALLYCVAGIALFGCWGLDSVWTPRLEPYRVYTLIAGVLAEVLALRKFLFRQIGVDMKNVYVMWRDVVVKTIPITSILDVRVQDNKMRIIVAKKSGRPKLAFKTRRYIRNRGVLLHLIREAHELLMQPDTSTPIVPIRSIAPEPGAKTENGSSLTQAG